MKVSITATHKGTTHKLVKTRKICCDKCSLYLVCGTGKMGDAYALCHNRDGQEYIWAEVKKGGAK